MNYQLISHGLLAAWMITNFSPAQTILKNISHKAPTWLYFIFTLLSCIKCCSFWITLGLTQDIWSAITASVIAATYDRIINSFKIYL